MKEYRMIRIETALDIISALTPKNKAIQYCLDIINEELALEECEFEEEEEFHEPEEFTCKSQEELCKEQTIDALRGIFSVRECYTVDAALHKMNELGIIAEIAKIAGIKSNLFTRALNGQNVKAVREWLEPLLPTPPNPPLPPQNKDN